MMRGFSGNIEAFDINTKKVVRSTKGYILVEMDPVRYQLESLVFDQDKMTEEKMDRVTLNITLANSTHMKDVSWHTAMSWGAVPGVVRGLPVAVEVIHID